jgi:hypothetical protein
MSKIIKCSLCDMEFDLSDPDYKKREIRHVAWHEKAMIQKRNTTQGVPKFG